MTYKQIETSREIRLWLGQVVIPAILVATTAMTIPGVRHTVVGTIESVKRTIKTKFRKES